MSKSDYKYHEVRVGDGLLRYARVTSVVNIIADPVLIAWFKRETPEEIEAKTQAGCEKGSRIHEWLEWHIGRSIGDTAFKDKEEPSKEDVETAIESFLLWESTFHPIYITSEQFVYSHALQVSGTFDLLCKIPSLHGDDLVLIDFKSSNMIDKKMDIQTTLYKECYEEMHHDIPGAEVKHMYILRLDKNRKTPQKNWGTESCKDFHKCRYVPKEALSCVTLFYYQEQPIVYDPVIPKQEEVAF